MSKDCNKKTLALLIVVVFLNACTPAGGVRPTMFMSPTNYLKNFSLNTLSEDDMLKKAGPPDREFTLGGKRALTYKVNKDGNMTYTYIFENGVVSDVIYNENGILNGRSSKGEQQKP